ncbi:ATP-binding protein [Phaeocystidibacter luteus]|uniref:histidine kinase n=1 Tax=Phaeocystidibacter luteus TaxID=911197 RepID=A0A6N6RFB2_9FLAO|nr:ATP-binding protein [Phaeocystidibacter luteus]KAB2808035.1 response regulator [Phaeocystidibacter luteus]
MSEELEILRRRLEREKAARKQAEQHLEQHSLELYKANKRLTEINDSLEKEIEERMREIKRQKEFYELIFNVLPARLGVLDSDGRYIFINSRTIPDPKLREWCYGKTNEEVAEKIQMPKDVVEKRIAVFEQLKANPTTADWVEKWHIDGKDKYILSRLHPQFDSEGKLRFYIGYGVNVTENVHANMRLEKAKEEAEAATQAKSDFLSKMTHEIRTPLNAITGLTDVLLKENPQSNEYLEAIKYSADSLLGIINEILDFSKIEAGKMVYENIPFSPTKVFEGIRRTFDYRISEKGLAFEVDYTDLPDSIKGDPQKLSQAMVNLIGNAVKFTANGSITVKAKFERNGEQGNLNVCVCDTGIGIPAERLDSVFASFEQSESSTSRHYGGTGLGLTITQRFIEGMGGSIHVTSEVDKGSRFEFNIPYTWWNDRPNQSEVRKTEVDLALDNSRFLLVEDNLMNQLVFKKMIERWNPTIETASNGEDAIRMMKEQDWDIVFLDIQMPIKSGIETIQEWRQFEGENSRSRQAVVALTADAFEESRKKAIDAGMDDFLTKPVSTDELRRIIIKFMGEQVIS